MVIKQIKQWFVSRANASRWRTIADWAEARGAQFRQTRDGLGFVIEQAKGRVGGLRVEWGPSQRNYVTGSELRMRCELKLNADLQMMVLCRQLMDTLEKAVFEAYTDTLKTRVDTDTPEEMRWLVMFPKATSIASKLVRSRFGAVGVNRDVPVAWLDGELSDALAQSSQDLLPEWRPFVLLTMRGNVYLRVEMKEASLQEVQSFMRILETACQSALRVNSRLADGGPWPTTTSLAWQSKPGEDGAAGKR